MSAATPISESSRTVTAGDRDHRDPARPTARGRRSAAGGHRLPTLRSLNVKVFAFFSICLVAVSAVTFWIQLQFLEAWSMHVSRAALRTAEVPAILAIELLDDRQAENIVQGLLESGNFTHVEILNDFGEVMAQGLRAPATDFWTDLLMSIAYDDQQRLLEQAVLLPSGQTGLLRATVVIGVQGRLLLLKLLLGPLITLAAMVIVILIIHRRGTARLLQGIAYLRNWTGERRQRATLRLASAGRYQFEEILELGAEFDETITLLEKGMLRLAEQQESFERLSVTDPMTRFFNRRQLDRIASCVENSSEIVVVFVDVDDFKRFNDRYGHSIGDRVLRFVAEKLMQSLEPLRRLQGAVVPIRYGGDEFLIVAGVSDIPQDVLQAAVRSFHDKATRELSSGLTLFGQPVRIGITAGYAIERIGSRQITAMIDDATFAMRLSKTRMKGMLCNLSSSESFVLKKQKLIQRDIEMSLASSQLYMVYQPIFTCRDSRLSGFEALMRWNHPDYGEFLPRDFISLLERGALAAPSAFRTMELVIADLARLQREARWRPGLRMSFNLSAEQLLVPGLIDHFDNCCRLSRVQGHSLQLEMTETVELENESMLLEQLGKFRQRGVSIALDDFGAGYSVLNILLKMPFDKLKLDRSLVDHSIDTRRSSLLLDHLTSMCRDLGVTTVCEGIEVVEQFDRVRRSGCDEVQGYLFGRPQPFELVRAGLDQSAGLLVEVA
ncbi:MAG: EAL domain-containing protein [Geminicoccaceae bacterium]|nr:EAL domain-containing protein [Geminicoccaceae bacterium]